MKKQANYVEFDAVILANNTAMGAAECHGALSGMLCVNRRLAVDEWLLEILGLQEAEMLAHEQALLVALFEQTRHDLEAFNFDFELLLPDDDAPLTERAEALSCWCKGFLHGLGSLAKGVICDEDAQEVLRDIYQIADLQAQEVADNDDEEAYTELVEYLRVGVQLLRSEFQAPVDNKRLH